MTVSGKKAGAQTSYAAARKRKAGAPKMSQAVAEIEGLVQQYHSLFITDGVFPDMKFTGEARQL
jgi:hypothetical protein